MRRLPLLGIAVISFLAGAAFYPYMAGNVLFWCMTRRG